MALGKVLPGLVESLAFVARKKELALDISVLPLIPKWWRATRCGCSRY